MPAIFFALERAHVHGVTHFYLNSYFNRQQYGDETPIKSLLMRSLFATILRREIFSELKRQRASLHYGRFRDWNFRDERGRSPLSRAFARHNRKVCQRSVSERTRAKHELFRMIKIKSVANESKLKNRVFSPLATVMQANSAPFLVNLAGRRSQQQKANMAVLRPTRSSR